MFTSFTIDAESIDVSGKNPSLSNGTPMNGTLTRGEVLPKRGAGYELLRQARSRKARFAVSELVAIIKEAAFRVERNYRGSVLKVGDLSRRLGGPIEHHGSHQNGRDVDLLFYLRDMKGRMAHPEAFIPIDGNGYSIEPPMTYRFDTERNWALVKALLTSKRAVVQWIFVSHNLKQLLLDFAHQTGESKQIIHKAQQVLHQPGPKTHVDHFHVRIYCPSGDKPGCRDVGPRWTWMQIQQKAISKN